MGAGQKGRRDAIRRWAKNNPEQAKTSKKASARKWRAKNRPKVNKKARDSRNGEELLCKIRKKHQKEMKDDPRSLSPDFINTILDLESDDYESLKPLPFLETLK